ncbi:glycerol-3-phosphate 1-O-acyltransferase PlsY [Amantichitinum ursilacus]|uniref:Glycerol-3-phosphate acyltransferase n=1 Tax=Amantichitinum ursilacus TaxID=857265 RepID=A0A0N0XK33_9NEIS|nr:glycerol-3-phosphate 1-O-acyltransferase PlsY [Amantichitinum ursilacus]KPC51943.1 putative glycerol-3-phosphate acyltransferase [Amantichitinum ursilacus]
MQSFIVVVAAYLIGSLSFAVIVSRGMGLADPRSYGSGNPGATNVLRSGNRKAAALTLLGDAIKGLVAVLLARVLVNAWQLDPALVPAAALAVTLGHMWPIFFRFAGGKGVATALGVLLGLDWRVGVIVLLVWLIIAKGLKISSLAALVAALIAPLLAWYFMPDRASLYAVTVISVLLIARHHKNIRGLLSGSERRITGRDETGQDRAD